MSDTPCIPFRFDFRREGNLSYPGERVVPFEDTRGRQPWEIEEVRRQTPVSRCPGFWKGILMQERDDARRARRTLGLDGAPELAMMDSHREPSVRLLEAWAPVENELRQAVEPETFAMWLADIHPHRLSQGVWYLACRPQACGWIRDRFGRLIESCAGRPVVFVNYENNQRRTP